MNIKSFTILRCLGIFALLISANLLMAQSQTPLDIALRHIENNHKSWDLSKEDVSDIAVSDSHISSLSGAAHIYFQQKYQGVRIYNAILNVTISDQGEVLYTGKRFVTGLATKVNTTAPSISAQDALVATLNALGKTVPSSFSTKEEADNSIVFDKGDFSFNDVKVMLNYFKNKEGNLILSYGLYINPADDIEMWQMHVDATTGTVINQRSLVVKCNHDINLGHRHNSTCNNQVVAQANSVDVTELLAKSNNSVMANSYRVFKYPTESPTHGPHEIVVNPEDLTASSLGWHDTGNNQYTITRGNNVHAFLDRNIDGVPDIAEPDGGATLDFDFPYDIANDEPTDVQDAATVNLFYLNNFLHDFSYSYGFDEAAGNFQVNNFGNGGAGNDDVQALVQAGADDGAINNATMGTPPDGSSPTMSMFVWDQDAGGGKLEVTAPSAIAGAYNTADAAFGPEVTSTPICGEVVIVNDNVNNPYATDGCEEDFANGAELEGKIALIDRGGCFFQDKTLHAQAYGAIAVILCNFEDDPVALGAGGTGADPTIPTLSIGNTDCQTIRQFANGELEVCFVDPDTGGPALIDGDFDNGIVAHEFAHGISNRLTGGGNNTDCLGNAEQMGEGWSDWVSLVVTAKEGDTGEMGRGIGNFAVRLGVDGAGIRRFRYSTDMNICPLTYSNVASNPQVHALGEVWCAVTWDLYWAMVDVYGWSPDLNHGTLGNNMAISLVMEAMKIQPCEPGFISGRDAILAADMALYNGENQCLIWDVFARRGMGFYAEENSTNNTGDQIESFESRPTCTEELKIKKSVSSLIEAGDDLNVTLTITNHQPDPAVRTNVLVTDQLVDGLSYISGSVSANVSDVTQNGNTLTFTLGDMNYLDELIVTYKLETASDNFSIRKDFDDVEYDADGSLDWWTTQIVTQAANQFLLDDNEPYAGDQCWFVADEAIESQHRLNGTRSFTIDGDRPVMRFYSKYDTEGGADGGLFEFSTDGGNTFQQLGDDMIRNGYPAGIQYATFVVPNLSAFSGNSDGYEATYVDMSDYAGETVQFRFHFATDDNTATGGGWWIDNIEYMDMVNYNTTVCVTSDQGDNNCAIAIEEGTIVESQLSVSTSNPESSVQLGVYPNPASDVINVSIATKQNQDVDLSILTLDGKTVQSRTIQTSVHTQLFSLDVASLPAGFYLVKAASKDDVVVEKVVIK